ncbi:MAG: glycoside hydrolase domain-containing protein, partial [Nocardioidaceae bacterium]
MPRPVQRDEAGPRAVAPPARRAAGLLSRQGGAAETPEDATDDHGLADWARRLGRDGVAATFTKRARWWENTFNPDATAQGGYQQARNADGSWVAPYSPATDVGFAQGTSATYTWMVQHDVARLAELMGGRTRAAARLDSFFRAADESWNTSAGPLCWAPTNEPGIHTPQLLNELGQPRKTQRTDGCLHAPRLRHRPGRPSWQRRPGSMSAWCIWSVLGMYPQTPSRGDVLLSSPTFRKAWIRRHGGPNHGQRTAAPGMRHLRPRRLGRRSRQHPVLAARVGAEPRRQGHRPGGGHPTRPGGPVRTTSPVDHGMPQREVTRS